MLYGTPYENYRTPFSNISINAEFGRDDSSKINMISVYGSLKGWRIDVMKRSRQLLVLSANYDYINNEAFFYSAQSLKLNLFSEFRVSHSLKINTSLGGGPVLLAAVPDIYPYENRYYDYCAGLGFHGSAELNITNRLFYSINYRGGWLKTISGNASHYFLHAITSEIRYRLFDTFSLCAEPGYFSLRGDYSHFDNVDRTYPYVRISVRYEFSF